MKIKAVNRRFLAVSGRLRRRFRLPEWSSWVIVLCEKLFLTKVLLNDNELKQIVNFYNVNYDDLRSEQRMYKVAFDEKNQ